MIETGNSYLKNKEIKKAVKSFSDAVRAYPDYPLGHFYLGRAYYIGRQYEKAVSQFDIFEEKAKPFLASEPSFRPAYLKCLQYLTETYFNMKDYGNMRRAIDEVLRLEPEQQQANYNLGVYCYKYEHSAANAYRAFNKVISIDPDNEAAGRARYAIDFIRANPDSRIAPDFSFINKE